MTKRRSSLYSGTFEGLKIIRFIVAKLLKKILSMGMQNKTIVVPRVVSTTELVRDIDLISGLSTSYRNNAAKYDTMGDGFNQVAAAEERVANAYSFCAGVLAESLGLASWVTYKPAEQKA